MTTSVLVLRARAIPNPKKICKILSKSAMYIIEGAISAEIAVFLKICYDTFK